MTWESYWLPHLIDWTLGAAGSAIVAWLVRRWIGRLVVVQDATAESAGRASIDASQAADDAAAVRQRLESLEARVGDVGDSISASLGHRIGDDLRFRTLEQQLGRLGERRGAS